MELSEESLHAVIGARGIEGTIQSLPFAMRERPLAAFGSG
jgi:hypothetical protein